MKTKSLNQIWKQIHPDDNVQQIIDKICGDFIDFGQYRDVYKLKDNPNYVVKIERDPSTGRFSNVCEWINWTDNKEWDYLFPWLCPCERINQTGQILVQRYAEPIPFNKLPEKIPTLFTDTKIENWGLFEGRPVLVDYPFFVIHSPTNKFKKVKWNFQDKTILDSMLRQ